MTNYLVILENRVNIDEDLKSFIIEAANLLDAQTQMSEYSAKADTEVYIQSVNSIWLHNDIRRAKRVH